MPTQFSIAPANFQHFLDLVPDVLVMTLSDELRQKLARGAQ